MKKILTLLLTVLLSVSFLTACSSSPQKDEKAEVVVFAAASMTETISALAESYQADHPDVRLTFHFDSSGTLKTQIAEGADCDLFISAAQKQMDEMDPSAGEEKNPEGLELIDPDTRVDLLENKVALCVPEGNPKGINSYEDLAKALKNSEILLAMGNADVPVGQYTQRILAYCQLDEEALASAGKLTYGSNVKEVAAQVKEAAVDCGIVYQTDAYSAELTIVDTATEEMCGKVIYPAAVLKGSKQKAAAGEFLAYLQSDKAGEIFSAVGFTPIR